MIHLVYRHAFGDDVEDKRVKMLALVATFLLVFFFSPVYGQVMLWESGATNYLWNLVLILLYLLPMRLYADGREDESPVGKHTPLYALLSLIAGCTNENTGAGVVCLSLALLWQAHKKYGRVNRRYLASTALFVIGYIALVAAPGNYARKNSYAGIREASTFRQIESAIAGTANLYIDAKALLIPLVIFLAFMAYDYVYEKGLPRLPLGFFLASLAMVVTYSASGFAPTFSRSMFGATVFLLVADLMLMRDVFSSGTRIVRVICLVALPIALCQGAYALVGLVNLYHQQAVIERYTLAQKDAGNLDIVVPAIERNFETKYSPFYELENITPDDTGYYTNACFCFYYDVNSVVSMDRQEWRATYGDDW